MNKSDVEEKLNLVHLDYTNDPPYVIDSNEIDDIVGEAEEVLKWIEEVSKSVSVGTKRKIVSLAKKTESENIKLSDLRELSSLVKKANEEIEAKYFDLDEMLTDLEDEES